jgi:hypothetical protein
MSMYLIEETFTATDIALPMELLFFQLTVKKRRNPYYQRNI